MGELVQIGDIYKLPLGFARVVRFGGRDERDVYYIYLEGAYSDYGEFCKDFETLSSFRKATELEKALL